MLMEIANAPSMSNKPADTPQDHGQEINLQEFQTRLEHSLGNIQAMVESWLPKDLRSAHTQPAHPLSASQNTAFGLDSSRPRNSKLGLGSAPPKHPPSQLSTSKLHSQLTKKPKTDLELGKGAEEALPCHDPRGEESEEDSRASTIGRKRPAPSAASASSSFDLLLHPPSKLASSSSPPPPKKKKNSPLSLPAPPSLPSSSTIPPVLNPHGLSKRQLKKLRKLERARSLAASTAASSNPAHSSASTK